MKGIFPGWLLLFVCMALCGATRGAGAAVAFDWAVVGDPGNAADANGFGSVPQAYLASKHAVTNTQYAEFLNRSAPPGHCRASVRSTPTGRRASRSLASPGSDTSGRTRTASGGSSSPDTKTSPWSSCRRSAPPGSSTG